MTPIIIGICGRSCCGKSTTSKKLVSDFPDLIELISADKFTISFNEQNKFLIEWERPESLRIDKLIDCIKQLKSGKSVKIPSKRCTEIYDKEIFPKKIIIVEGFLLFTNKTLIDLFDYKFFIDVTDDQILHRRIERKENDSFLDDLDYIKRKIIPISKEYEEQQKKEADLVVPAEQSFKETKKQIEDIIIKYLI
ncbi:MAG: hypothetical protein WCX82_02140 [archaeon]|jgi:uridine kinase